MSPGPRKAANIRHLQTSWGGEYDPKAETVLTRLWDVDAGLRRRVADAPADLLDFEPCDPHLARDSAPAL